MSVRHVVEYVLLAAGVGIELLCAIGVLAMSNVYERLHYAAASTFGALLVAVAVTVRESFSLIADKALLAALFLLVSGPVAAHVTARAARVRELGHWTVTDEEQVEVEER